MQRLSVSSHIWIVGLSSIRRIKHQNRRPISICRFLDYSAKKVRKRAEPEVVILSTAFCHVNFTNGAGDAVWWPTKIVTLSKGLPGNNLFSLICYIVIKIILKAGDFGPKFHEIVSFHLEILFEVSCVYITKILNPSVKLFFVFLFPPSIFYFKPISTKCNDSPISYFQMSRLSLPLH